MKYVFKDSPVTIKNGKKASAQKIGDALEAISKANAGRLTPKATVEAARNSRNQLHRHFEWDDAKAGEAYRIGQAQELIRVIRVVDEDRDEPQRAFLSVKDGDGTAYHSYGEVKTSRDLQLAVMKQAHRDLEAWEKRYSEFEEAFTLVQQARVKLNGRIAAQEARV